MSDHENQAPDINDDNYEIWLMSVKEQKLYKHNRHVWTHETLNDEREIYRLKSEEKEIAVMRCSTFYQNGYKDRLSRFEVNRTT